MWTKHVNDAFQPISQHNRGQNIITIRTYEHTGSIQSVGTHSFLATEVPVNCKGLHNFNEMQKCPPTVLQIDVWKVRITQESGRLFHKGFFFRRRPERAPGSCMSEGDDSADTSHLRLPLLKTV